MEGKRATPTVSIGDGENRLVGAVEDFWQNFPKAIDVHHNQLSMRLFPQQYNDVYELQGGEQKTHSMFLQFDRHYEPATHLDWVHDRLVPRTTPAWYADSKAVSYLTPGDQDPYS